MCNLAPLHTIHKRLDSVCFRHSFVRTNANSASARWVTTQAWTTETWAGLSRIGLGHAINSTGGLQLMSPRRPEKSCRVNKMKKVLRDTLLPLFMHIYIGREPGRQSALEIQGKNQRQRRRGILKLRAPDNQYLTTSRQFCWRDGNMKKTASQPLSSLSPVSNMPLYHFYFMLTVNFWNATPLFWHSAFRSLI